MDYIPEAKASSKKLLQLAKKAKTWHQKAALLHGRLGGQHRKAGFAHIRKAGKLSAIVTRLSRSEKRGDQKSLSNEAAFRVDTDNERRAAKCSSSAAHAERMVTHLELASDDPREAEFHLTQALHGAPYKLPRKCGEEPFPF